LIYEELFSIKITGEPKFLTMICYKYPRPSLTVDAVVFKQEGVNTYVLLIQRKNPPYQNKWALPGGFVDMDETLESAVSRELMEETGISDVEFQQLHAFSSLERDPRGRTVSVVFWGWLPNKKKPVAGDDAADARWFNLNNLPLLAFDHQEILQMAIGKL